MSKPVISFIIPVYNCEKYLAESLKSILFQESQCFEMIVINDGSTDRSLEIITDFADKYDCIRYKTIKNSGVSVARNTGLANAKGEYIAFLDADDVLCSNILTEELIDIISREKPDMIGMEYFNGTSKLKKGKRHTYPFEGMVFSGSKELFRSMQNGFWSFLYKSSLINDNHICFPEGVKHAEDRAFQYHATLSAKNLYLYKKPWCIYRNHSQSVMHKTNTIDYIVDDNIRAWGWLRNKGDSQLSLFCDQRIFSCMSEYIELSVVRGTPLDKIVDVVTNNKEFKQALENYDKYWKGRHNAEVFHSFCESPESYYKKKRKQRIANRILRPVASSQLVRDLYLQLTYKVDLSEYTRHIK